MMYISVLFLIVIQLLVQSSALKKPPHLDNEIPSPQSSCLPSLPSFKRHSGPEAFYKGTQTIIPSLVVKCSGQVIAWDAFVEHHESNTVQFQIWRPLIINDTSSYILIGANTLVNMKPLDHKISLNVDDTSRISVEVGDVIGIYTDDSKHGFQVEAKPHPHTHPHTHPRSHPHNRISYFYYTTDVPDEGEEITLLDEMIEWKSRDWLPIISVTIANTTSTVTDNSIPNITLCIPTDRPQPSSASTEPTIATTTTNRIEDIPDPVENIDSEKCDFNTSAYLLTIILVLTITVLLVIVCVLGITLMFTCIKLRHLRAEGEMKEFGRGHSRSNDKEFFENPNYMKRFPELHVTKVVETKRNKPILNNDKQIGHEDKNRGNDHWNEVKNGCTSTRDPIRGFNVQKHEKPSNFPSNDSLTSSNIDSQYAHPRIFSQTTMRVQDNSNNRTEST